MIIQKIKKQVFTILESTHNGNLPGRIFGVFIMALISINVALAVIETVESISKICYPFFYSFEVFSVIVFTIEYVLRLWTCTIYGKYSKPIKGRLRYAITPMAIIDLIAILPFYLPMIIPFHLIFMRALRLFRILRIIKMGRYSKSLRTFAYVFDKKKEELMLAVFVVLIMLVIVSSLMFLVENTTQPKAFSSIPMAMWWGVATLTTVGYGDVFPVTPVGKLLGAFTALLGIGIFAIPTGILGSGFVEEMYSNREKQRIICPHCGKDVDEPIEEPPDDQTAS